MIRIVQRTLLLGGLVTVGLVAGRGWSGSPFPHIDHADAECLDCHADAATSESGIDDLRPPSTEGCLDCHEAEEIEGVAWRAVPTQHAGFSHRRHQDEGTDCAVCHGESGGQAPSHDTCFACHETAEAEGDCRMCHLNLSERKPLDHASGYLHSHQFEVRSGGMDRCEECHRSSQLCLDCHQGENVDFLSHPRNYLFSHAEDARKRLTDCAACHDEEAFCVECHTSEGVLPLDHLASDWASPGTDGGFHALEARRDIGYCASCHDTGGEPICATCHGS